MKNDMREGRLIRLCPQVNYPIDWSYYAVYTADKEITPQVCAFRDWLQSMTRE